MEEKNVKYLYGAAVQGIQSFIYQTNELKNIIGASEIVEKICTSAFEDFGKDSIVRAAGNIKHIFEKKEACEKAVREFPMKVMGMAPNVTVSQAVVKMEGDYADFGTAVDELERKLRAQRNKPIPSITVGLMGIKRSPKTGLPAVKEKDGEFIDAVVQKAKEHDKANMRLCKYAFGEKIEHDIFPYDISDITDKNSWIAIIHADGNGLGQVVQKIGKNKEQFKKFSEQLDKATKQAAVDAYKSISESFEDGEIIPIRPIVLDGDDFTVICRADFAVEYVRAFLIAFEKQTQLYLGEILKNNKVFENNVDKLTACAGIAFIKSSYPFYYGYNLAETLCGEAKKTAKRLNADLAPSCLMFHKVQDSFIESFSEIETRELSTPSGISFKYGPYYTSEQNQPSIQELLDDVKALDSEEGNKIKSHIRQWMSALYESKDIAKQKRERVLSLLTNLKYKQLFAKATNQDVEKSAAYDMLALASVKYQVTK